jgi:hypothetical protein
MRRLSLPHAETDRSRAVGTDSYPECASVEKAFLRWVVYESDFIDVELRKEFIEAFAPVNERIESATAALQAVEDTNAALWRDLNTVGLLGASLSLKLSLGRRMAERAFEPAQRPLTGITGQALRPLLKWINSLLGSLARALPGIDLVKEYKEGVELVVENQRRRRSPPPIGIFKF